MKTIKVYAKETVGIAINTLGRTNAEIWLKWTLKKLLEEK